MSVIPFSPLSKKISTFSLRTSEKHILYVPSFDGFTKVVSFFKRATLIVGYCTLNLVSLHQHQLILIDFESL